MGNIGSRKNKGGQEAEGNNGDANRNVPSTSGRVSMGRGIPSLFRFPSAADVLEYFPAQQHSPAYACSSVQGKRIGMEDEHIAIRQIGSQQSFANLFGVFDGHGGKTVASYLKANLPGAVVAGMAAQKSGKSIEHVLKDVFLQTDAAFLRSRFATREFIFPTFQWISPYYSVLRLY